MGIVDDDVRKVREASDIVGIVSEHVQLKRVGRREQGLCPFHPEKTPSFSVNPEEGLYYCFGCGAKGDVITFVREVDGLDFVQAVEHLAKRAGVALHYTSANESAERQRRRTLVDAVRRAVDWYHERLLTSPDAGPARAYLRSRGLTGEQVRRYQVGWAPDAWDELARALRLPDKVLADSGLGFVNRRQRQQDAFRGRIMFPIFDVNGDPLGFGGRIMPGGEGPKYKNSSDGPLYQKSRVLYGLSWAKADVVAAGEVVICEGYTDVIGLAEAGVPRGVATCGTALTEEHIRTLKRFAPRVVLAFDADAAGQAAAERFYEWERKYDVDVAVAGLPAGVDPADLAREDPEALRGAIEPADPAAPLRVGGAARGAVPFLRFRLQRVLNADPRTPEDKAKVAQRAAAVIREHPDPLVRDQYLVITADALQVDEAVLRSLLDRPARGRADDRPGRPGGHEEVAAAGGPPARVAAPRENPTELEALRFLVFRRVEIEVELHEVLFASERTRAAYVALVRCGSLHEAMEEADPGAAELLARIGVEEPSAEEAADVVSQLLAQRLAEQLKVVEAEARAIAADYEGRRAEWAELMEEQRYLKEELGRLNRREADGEERGELVRFLSEDPDGDDP